MLTFHRFFCKSGSAVPAAHAEDQQQIIRAKWFHRAQFLACQTPSKAAFFQVWCHSCRFRKLKRQQQQYSRDVQKQKLADLMTDASHAAARHDSFAVYQAVLKYTPKQPKNAYASDCQTVHLPHRWKSWK